MPPVFSKSFYTLLASAAEEFGATQSELAIRALRNYIKELRVRQSPITDALDEHTTKQYSKVQSTMSKNYWATVSPEERKRRMSKAIEARWAKKKT